MTRFWWLGIALGIIAIVIFTLILPANGPASPVHSGELKAAIVDQLYSFQPNESFTEQVTQELKDYGFQVDVYRDDMVTVDLYRQLSSYGYKLIIFRVHSGLLIGSKDVANKVWLFTNETYSRMRHFTEQLTGKVALATTETGNQCVFAVNAKFIERSISGRFDKTAVIMMGCSGFRFDDLAQAFIQEGASTYLGWDASVGLSYVDGATTVLMEKICRQELAIADAVTEMMQERGSDPDTRAILRYYPASSANKTLRQLIQ